ncbi:MAG TPA: D-cysteine desulfhydrase family protein [Planctomycetota bacterium]|nr:D-cysteine desulfhydrase family protein [Planctomycetota bacterium]
MAFDFPARVPLALTPTPLTRLERLSKAWGADLWIKRDDLTGSVLSGNKIRKLEFEMAEAVAKKCKAVITCGAAQSNHARATAIAARQLGLEPHLLLRTIDGKPPAEWDGNALLDKLVGADITWVTPEQYRNERGTLMRAKAEQLGSAGKPAMVIPEGASDARGALGYVAAVREIAEQAKALGVTFTRVAHACGSGGTTAGLAIGNAIFAAGMHPVAFAVCDDEAYFRNVIDGIAAEFTGAFGGVAANDAKYTVIDRYKGIGYGLSTGEELAFLREIGTLEGVLLDPVYSGKAMFGVKQELAKGGGVFKKGESILFLHTGGMFGLFPKRAEFGF